MKKFQVLLKFMKMCFKGLIGLVSIKLAILLVALFVQSCQKDYEPAPNDQERMIALQKFENLINEQSSAIRSFTIDNAEWQIQMKSNNTDEFDANTVKDAQETLQPLVEGTIALLEAYGVTKADFEDNIDLNDPNLALIGMAILAGETKNEEITLNITNIIASPVFASDFGECAIHATGIAAIAEVAKGNLSKAALKKAATKLLKRSLGAVGAAWAVYELGDCMGWW